jgi:hypothetical protein
MMAVGLEISELDYHPRTCGKLLNWASIRDRMVFLGCNMVVQQTEVELDTADATFKVVGAAHSLRPPAPGANIPLSAKGLANRLVFFGSGGGGKLLFRRQSCSGGEIEAASVVTPRCQSWNKTACRNTE